MTTVTEDLNKCANEIINGNLVAFPTETVYGIGASIYNENAINKIFKYKGRPNTNPLIVHIHNYKQLEEITNLTERDLKLVKKITDILWPGPLTLILPKSNKVSKIITANTDYIGVRMPSNKIALDFLKKCNVPVAAPSANKYCHVSPTNYKHVLKEFKNLELAIIPNHSEILDIGIESSIFKLNFEDNVIELLRPGFITFDMLTNILPNFDTINNFEENNVPGSDKKHYAIKKKTFLLTKNLDINLNKDSISFLDFGDKYKSYGFKYYHTLSKNYDFYKAMQNLYSKLHFIENDNTELLIIYFPEENNKYYEVIYNRLIRCCSGNLINNNFNLLNSKKLN